MVVIDLVPEAPEFESDFVVFPADPGFVGPVFFILVEGEGGVIGVGGEAVWLDAERGAGVEGGAVVEGVFDAE